MFKEHETSIVEIREKKNSKAEVFEGWMDWRDERGWYGACNG